MKKLFEKQEKLEGVILNNFIKRIGQEVTHKQLTVNDLLNVNTEIAEFVEEKDHVKKLVEFADITHALLNCGLALGISESISKHDITLLYAQSVENNYQDAILNLIVKFGKFANNVRLWKYWSIDRKPRNIEKHYFKCFLALFDLAKTMGYSVSDIKQAYGDKNRENVRRQQEGY